MLQTINCTRVLPALVVLSTLMRLISPLCSPPDITWRSYSPTPAPMEFEGTPTTGVFCGNGCLGPINRGSGTVARLADGDYGTTTLDVSAVHAWNTNVNIVFTFASVVQVRGINLYFYNIPSRNIGLPYDTVLSVPSFIEGNQDLSQSDNQLRNVTLIPTSLLSGMEFTIQFRFSNRDKIDWLLLTEVEICTGVTSPLNPPPIAFTDDTMNSTPSSINSTFSLSCTVENDGRFTWSWTLPSGDTRPPTFILDTGRTSVLELSQISSNDNGDYQCRVEYDGLAEQPAMFTHTITLQGELQAVNSFVPVTEDNVTITLWCHLYGYILPEEPSIVWFLNNDILTNGSVYTITYEAGDRLIQNGGTQTRPSLISYLSINLANNPVIQDQIYFCQSSLLPPPGLRQITLSTNAAPIETATTSITTTDGFQIPTHIPSSGLSLSVTLGAVFGSMGGLLLISIIITIVIVIVCIVRMSNHRTADQETYYDYPDMNPQIPPRHIEVKENAAYGHRAIELVHCSAPEQYYESVDNLDLKSTLSPPQSGTIVDSNPTSNGDQAFEMAENTAYGHHEYLQVIS